MEFSVGESMEVRVKSGLALSSIVSPLLCSTFTTLPPLKAVTINTINEYYHFRI